MKALSKNACSARKQRKPKPLALSRIWVKRFDHLAVCDALLLKKGPAKGCRLGFLARQGIPQSSMSAEKAGSSANKKAMVSCCFIGFGVTYLGSRSQTPSQDLEVVQLFQDLPRVSDLSCRAKDPRPFRSSCLEDRISDLTLVEHLRGSSSLQSSALSLLGVAGSCHHCNSEVQSLPFGVWYKTEEAA